jgi:predicted MFS family arabinose efflux permease
VLLRATAGFQFSAVAAVAPLMMAELSLSGAQLGLLVGVYSLPALVLLIPGAAIARRFGDRRVVLAMLVAMAAGALITAAATRYDVALAGRLVAGSGGVLVMMLVTRMAAERFAGPRSASAVASVLASWPGGMALALLVIGPFAQWAGWRAALLLTAAVPLVFVASRGWVRSAAAAAPAGSPPMFSFSTAEVRTVVLVCIAWALINGAFSAYVAFLPALFNERGLDVGDAAMLSSLAVGSMALLVPFGGWVADRTRRPRLVMVGGSLLGAAAVALTVAPFAPAVWVMLLAAGVLIALPPGPMGAALAAGVGPGARAAAFAIFSMSSNLGTLIMPAIAGAAGDVFATAAAAILAAAVALAISGLCSFAIGRPQPVVRPGAK